MNNIYFPLNAKIFQLQKISDSRMYLQITIIILSYMIKLVNFGVYALMIIFLQIHSSIVWSCYMMKMQITISPFIKNKIILRFFFYGGKKLELISFLMNKKN